MEHLKGGFLLLKFEQAGAKDWKIIVDGSELIKLHLLPSSVTNKYHIVTGFIASNKDNKTTTLGAAHTPHGEHR